MANGQPSMVADGWWLMASKWLFADGSLLSNDSFRGYLVHGPYFPRYTCLHIRKWTKLNRLSDYLTHCIQRADFNFMETYGLYYSYSQSWTHSPKGFLVHGPYFLRRICLNIRNCTMFKRLSEYQNRCVQSADFHLMKSYGLHYSHPLFWTHSSKGYLVHGPYFPW